MKKLTLILLAILVLQATAVTQAAPKTYTVLLAGGAEENTINISLTPGGRDYVIDSVVQLEVGGTICTHPEANPNELICSAASIAGFEVNSGAGDDRIAVSKEIAIPVTMRGGAGDDFLLGGSGADKLEGGAGDDRLVGWHGADLLYGGPGKDVLIGGRGSDLLRGGPGKDVLSGGQGADDIRQHQRGRP